jgi:thiol-disulfide isomerase/thioredoxin
VKRVAFLGIVMMLFAAFASADEVTDLDGTPIDLSHYRGRWLLVNYWSSGCSHCIAEIPLLKQFYQRYHPDRATVIAINLDEDPDVARLRAIVAQHAIPWPIIVGGEDPPLIDDIVGLPASFLLDPSSQLVARFTGPVALGTLEAAIVAESANRLEYAP